MSDDPKSWGAVPFSSNPLDWGAVQVSQALPPDVAAAHLKRLAQAQQELDNAPGVPAPNAYEREGHGILRANQGVEHLFRKLADAVGLPGRSQEMADNMARDEALYQAGRGKDAGIDWWSGVGDVSASAPLAVVAPETKLASVVANRAVQGGATGAVAGLIQPTYTASLGDNAKNAAISGAAGAVTAPAAGWLGDKAQQGIQWIMGKIRGIGADKSVAEIASQIPELGRLGPDQQADIINEARKQLSATGDLNAEQLSRKANLLANGATPTTSMVTRDPIDWSRERNLQKLGQNSDPVLNTLGQDLTNVYSGNDKAFGQQLTNLRGSLPVATQEAHGEAVMRGIADASQKSQQAVSSEYGKVNGNDIINPPMNALTEKLFHPDIQDIEDPAVRSITGTVTNRLKRLGIIEAVPEPQPGFGSAPFQLTGKAPTAKQSEELRKLLVGLDAPNRNALRIKTDLIKSIDDATQSMGGEDVFGAARKAAAARFGMLENPAAERALSTLGEVQQGKAAQQFVKSQVINAADQDVASLLNVLKKSGDEQSLQHMQAGVLQYLQDQGVNANSGKFSGSAFNNALRDIGDTKLNAIFGAEKADKLRSLGKAALDATYEPAYSAVNHSNTGPFVASMLEKGRALLGVNLPMGLNQTTQTIAERAGYQSQLAKALAARASAPPVALSPQAAALADALQKIGAMQAAKQIPANLPQQ